MSEILPSEPEARPGHGERDASAERGSPLDRLPTAAWAVLGALVVAIGFALGLRLDASDAPLPAAAQAVPGAPTQGRLDGFQARHADGRVAPLVTPGEPLVVMVSSATCAVCDEAMRDIGRAAEGRPLPRLRIVTLEGESSGAPMLARNRLTQAWHAGPADGAGQVLLTFQFPGTPTFLFVDADGTVRRALPGYPGWERMRPWYDVMTGARPTL